MLSGDLLYYGMNGLIAVIALISVFAIPKLLPDAQSRKRLTIAFILLVASGIFFSVALRVFRMVPIVYGGMLLGKVPKSTYTIVDGFKNVALAGNILDLAAVILLISVTKMLMGKVSRGTGKESA